MNFLRHIAFIIDGNRRWAKAKGKPSFFGHRQGGKVVEQVIKWCLDRKIPHLTFWVLSTENLKERSQEELTFLFKMIGELPAKIAKQDKGEIKITTIGDLSKLPEKCQKALQKTQLTTQNNKKMTVTLAVNYGGHDELVRAVKRIINTDVDSGQITEELLSSYLDTAGQPAPDLIIRTGGKRRLSGLFSWQSAYSELYFIDTFWPDFDETELDKAIDFFHQTQRNFGK